MTIKTYTIEEQVRIVSDSYPKNYLRAAARINAKHRQLQSLMLQRMREQGLAEYGDRAFRLSKRDLIREADEEIADLLFYDALIDAHERGVFR